MGADFSGYVTKADVKCSDGRYITPEAFKHMNGVVVPLVWQHGHDTPENVLGHMILESRADGVYGYGYFNNSPKALASKEAVQHKDIRRMSIYANQIVEKTKKVLHGMIREVSLVLSGANPGAVIDWVKVVHSDDPNDFTVLSDEAVIYTGLELEHEEGPVAVEEAVAHMTARDVYDSLTEEQRDLVHFMVASALKTSAEGVEHSDGKTVEKPDDADDSKTEKTGTGDGAESTDGKTADKPDDQGDLAHQEGTTIVTKNVFEQGGGKPADNQHVLTHSDIKGIFADAQKTGSFKAALDDYAVKHGIEDISVLFPDARTINNTPEFNQRRMEWVTGVINGTGKTPFSKVKTITADITQPEARAKGYIKGEYKKEEWFNVTKRTTGPATIYKKQKLDRDDIIDITDFDVVAWMKGEMEMMLKEELARAILIGDGRDIADEDKIKDPAAANDGDGIRSILNEHELFATTVNVNIDDASSSYLEVVDAVTRARRWYKGTGTPTFYTTELHLSEMLLLRDESNSNRRLFSSVADLATALRVREIVTVEPMEDSEYEDLIGIIVNLADYNIGTNRGGQITNFEDFDIDYNQYKYLIETRLSGALTKIKSALILKKTDSANVLVDPNEPTFVESTGVVTIPSQTGVVYKNDVTNATLTAGAQSALAEGATLKVRAEPASGYYFGTNAEDQWSFTRPAA
jgi:hypothetical protein